MEWSIYSTSMVMQKSCQLKSDQKKAECRASIPLKTMIYRIFVWLGRIEKTEASDDNGQPVAGNCHHQRLFSQCYLAAVLLVALLTPGALIAHGGVVMEEDQCVIDIGLFRAHFTIYQPETSASKEFCEEVPDTGLSIFVMDYLHDSLRTMPVDFRVIRDINNKQAYASWEDIQSISDLEAVTVFYGPGRIEPGGSLTVQHDFEDEGWYIGIVTTRQPDSEKIYRAVFGFHVGGRGPGYWPLLLLIALMVQIQYWVSSGGWERWRAKHGNRSDRNDASE